MKARATCFAFVTVASSIFAVLLTTGRINGRSDEIDADIQMLTAPEGKVKDGWFFNPGGPIFRFSEPMNRLVERGNAIQWRLLEKSRDPRIRNEVALILASIGDKEALPRLIELLPRKEALTDEESFSTMCLLYALWQLTGMELGIHHKWPARYVPEFRTKWLTWYEANKDYLYTPSTPERSAYNWAKDRVLVDFEAKMAGTPTTVYRKEHPRINYEEIKTWRNDLEYERKLRDFCFSSILNHVWKPYGYVPSDSLRALVSIRDMRALNSLRTICQMADVATDDGDFISTFEERGDPESIPFLENLIANGKKGEKIVAARLRMIERIRLFHKYGTELKGKLLDSEEQLEYIRCMEGSDGIQSLVATLRNRENDCFLRSELKVAGYVDREPVRACLKDLALDKTRDERTRTLAHGALAQLGEKDSLNYLKQSLSHQHPGVRLAGAECLWDLGSRDGFKVLRDIAGKCPIESAPEDDAPRIGPEIKGLNLDYIRTACRILGEMGDRTAIESLKRLLPLDINHFGCVGWSGRPDVVALAKLGDYSGISILQASINRGDPNHVVGSWRMILGDFVQIGLMRFIPEILPLLNDRDEVNRIHAAQDILLLLESGK